MKKKEQNKGITLIALVISIVVILILTGITAAMLVGQNGILINSEKAKMLTEIGEIEEKVKLKTLENINRGLISGKIDKLDLDLSDNLINKYKDILYIKDSKVYLSFISNYPQMDIYINNKDTIELLKNSLEISYDGLKEYNLIVNPYFNNGLEGYKTTGGENTKIEVLNENNNNYAHLEINTTKHTFYISQKVEVMNYNDILYINAKYRNSYFQEEEGYKINNDIIRSSRNSGGYRTSVLNKTGYLNSYNLGWKAVSQNRRIYDYYESLITTIGLGGEGGYATNWKYTIDFDYIYVINLTEIFGAGNEPTKQQMDIIFSNF